MLTATAYDTHVEQLFDRIQQLHSLLTGAGIPYRIVGGMAVLIHVFERDPLRARLTPDVDAAIERKDLAAVVEAAGRAGHLLFLNEKVRPEYVEAVPSSPPDRTDEGIPVATVADLVRMKLTSYRLKDRVHIQDLDGVGLISPEIEGQLPGLLLDRLAEIRASE
jgi:hypothetical protein